MPSGRYITAQVWCFAGECVMNIVVNALSEDRTVSEGLCGNYDGDSTNDLTQAGLAYPAYAREPIELCKHFMYVLKLLLRRIRRILLPSIFHLHLSHTRCFAKS